MSHDEIITKLPALLGDNYFRYRVLLTLQRLGIWHVDRGAIIAMRVHVAATLLSDGMPRSEAREALQVRFGVSRRSAYRLLDKALTARAPKQMALIL